MPVSLKPVKEEKDVLGKRAFVFDKSYASDFDPVTGEAGMLVSIGDKNVFVPCGRPVEIDYNTWSLLKNIGRIGRIVGIKKEENAEGIQGKP